MGTAEVVMGTVTVMEKIQEPNRALIYHRVWRLDLPSFMAHQSQRLKLHKKISAQLMVFVVLVECAQLLMIPIIALAHSTTAEVGMLLPALIFSLENWCRRQTTKKPGK